MENQNLNTPKHIFNISRKDFFNAWKMTFERKLRELHEEQIDISSDLGLDMITFDAFCETIFMTVPKYVETRDN